MKRKELIRHLKLYGCVLLKEGAKHSRYINLAEPNRISTLPRHNEIANFYQLKYVDSLGFQSQLALVKKRRS